MNPKNVIGKQIHDGPAVYDWFLHELKLIDRKLEVVWDKKACVFLIVTPAPVNVFRSGYVVEHSVSKKNGDFIPLDMRVIHYLQDLRFDRDHTYREDKYLAELDEEDFEVAKKVEKERLLMERDFIKKVNKFRYSTTFT